MLHLPSPSARNYENKHMIVDDEPDIRDLIEFALGSDLYELSEASDLAGLRRSLASPAPGS